MFLIGLVNSIPQKLDKENIYIHDDVLLDTIGQSISFLSEFVPTDIHVYKLLDNNNVKTIFESKPSFIKSFYKRTHIDYVFCISENDLFNKVLENKKDEKGIQGEIFNGLLLFQTLYPIFNRNNNIIGFLMVESSFDNLQKNINLKNYFHFSLFDKIIKNLLENVIYENIYLPKIKPNDGIIILDKTGIINYSNNIAINILKNIDIDVLIEGNNFHDVLQNGSWKIIQVNSLYYEQELNIKKTTLNIKSFLINDFTLIILSDITEIRNKNQEIEVKSYIIKEIHHRVKNNLQSIVSL